MRTPCLVLSLVGLLELVAASADFSQTNKCGTNVAAGASCTIQVTFDPTAPGTPIGSLTVQDNAASSPQVVTLSGTGNMTTMPVSQGRACRVARIPVSTFRYQSTQEPRTALRLRIREIAQARIRYGYRKIRVLLKREG